MSYLFRKTIRRRSGHTRRGTGRRWGRLLPGFLSLALFLAAGPAGAVGRVDRQGVYVLGGWFQYAHIDGKSRYGYEFSNGPGYSVHFRYNMSRKAALAIYFENQRYDAKADTLDQLKLTTAHIGIRFFSAPPTGDVLRYAEVTAGFYRPEIQYPKTQQSSVGTDIAFPGEGFLVHAGLGAEIFITQSWAVEFGAHGYGLTGRGRALNDPAQPGEKNWSASGQVALGIDYFMLR